MGTCRNSLMSPTLGGHWDPGRVHWPFGNSTNQMQADSIPASNAARLPTALLASTCFVPRDCRFVPFAVVAPAWALELAAEAAGLQAVVPSAAYCQRLPSASSRLQPSR